MTQSHRALIVEDDEEIADVLEQVAAALQHVVVRVDNHEECIARLSGGGFCYVLLDLGIKSKPAALRANREHGVRALREARQMYPTYNGTSFSLPIIVISGHANDYEDGIEVMNAGASFVIRKPFKSGDVRDRIERAMRESGRASHDQCALQQHPSPIDGSVSVVVTGEKVRRRVRILVNGSPVELKRSLLRTLLALVVAHLRGEPIHNHDLDGSADRGSKNISDLHDAVAHTLPDGTKLHKNHRDGTYSLAPQVAVGEVCVDRLQQLNDNKIGALALEIAQLRG